MDNQLYTQDLSILLLYNPDKYLDNSHSIGHQLEQSVEGSLLRIAFSAALLQF